MDVNMLDILWIVLCAGLVFNMQLGFLCLESGLTRSKNAINVAMKNMADLSIAVLLYWCFGFALMFGDSLGGWIGSSHFFLPSNSGQAWHTAFFLFQVMFCTTAATIVSGAAAERMRFFAYVWTAAMAAGLIYPVFGHWAWGGTFQAQSGNGWLAELGFRDFAGSTVVHSVGGWLALAVIMVIGPRQGRFDRQKRERIMPGSNLPLAMLGGLLLLFGWFGFNGGSALAFNQHVPGIMINTLLGAMAGTGGAMLLSWLRHQHIDAVWTLNGMIAGLVAITASAHAISGLQALLIGLMGSLVMAAADRLLVRFGIDDAVGAVPVHLAAGVWGTLALGLFADLHVLGTGLGRIEQLLAQLQGIISCALWAFGVSYIILRLLNRITPMRVSPDDEQRGLNISEHGSRTELIELLDAMAEHQRQGHFHKEVQVEPFTEVGQIASQYNKVIRALQQAVGKTQTIVRDIRDGILTFHSDGTLASCNPGAERLFGRSAEQLIGTPIDQLLLGQGHHWPRQLAQGQEHKQEVTLQRHDGSAFAAELTLSQGSNEDPLFICMVRDITERRRIEEQLFQEKMLAQVTLAAIGDGVISTDHLGYVRFLNPVAEDLTGWSHQDARGQALDHIYQLQHAVSASPLPSPLKRLNANRAYKITRSDGTPGVLSRADGHSVIVQDAIAPIRDSEGRFIGAVLTFRDITQTHQLAQELSFQASHDSLTGLENRSAFERRLSELLRQTHQDAREHVLCYMDLDQFKVVNDTCGHAAGDELLRQLTQVFKEQIRTSDTLARLGGDEFAILFHNCPVPVAQQIAERLRAQVQAFRFSWDGKTFAVGASIGLVLLDPQQGSLNELLSAADSACYAAKDAGRNRVHLYQADDQHLLERRGEMQWTSRLRHALDRDHLRLYVQTIVPTQSGAHAPRYEVLVRMLDEQGQIIPPGAFMPAAERYDLACAIDRWVVGNFLAWLGDNCRRANHCPGHYSLNLSAASLGDNGFLGFVLEAIERHQVPSHYLCFEITETSAIANLNCALNFMQKLKAIGCSFALDDFGSGLSSFAYLKTLPVDYLKIDGLFVKDLAHDSIARAMVSSINSIAHEMGLQTVAEFVESQAILEQLQQLGVDYAQGYHLGRPYPLSELSGVRMMPR